MFLWYNIKFTSNYNFKKLKNFTNVTCEFIAESNKKCYCRWKLKFRYFLNFKYKWTKWFGGDISWENTLEMGKKHAKSFSEELVRKDQ